MRRVAALALVLLLPGSAPGQTAVELVVDCSASMGERLGDGRTRLDAVQEAVASVIAALPEGDPGLTVGLRLSGGELSWSDPNACADSSLASPVAAVDRAALRDSLLAARPGGADALAFALERAAGDLSAGPSRRVVVLATDGDGGSCGNDYQAAAAALLAAAVELRVVGAPLGDAARPLAELTRVEPAASTAELVAGLRRAFEGAVMLEKRPQPVTLRVARGGAEVELDTAALVDPAGAIAELRPRDGLLRGEAAPGLYELRLGERSGSAWTVTHVAVDAGSPNDLVVGLPGAEVAIAVLEEPVTAGAGAGIRFAGAPPGAGWVAVVPAGAPVGERGERARVVGPEGEVHLVVPEAAGLLEVRYFAELPTGAGLLAGGCELSSRAAAARVEAAAEVEAGDLVDLAWGGPSRPGDCVLLVAAGAPERSEPACWSPVTGSSLPPLVAPDKPGLYEVRYLSGRSARMLARAAVTVVAPRPRLAVPDRVAAGATLTVTWSWALTPAEDDYLAVASAGAADGAYLSFAPTTDGSPARLAAPAAPGAYEVRFTRGQGFATLAAAPFAVVEVEAAVTAPALAVAGTRLTVAWRGPDRPGDYLAIAPTGAAADTYLDWAYTSVGSPLTLAAPQAPGDYEVRYSSDGRTLARAKVTVRPPS